MLLLDEYGERSLLPNAGRDLMETGFAKLDMFGDDQTDAKVPETPGSGRLSDFGSAELNFGGFFPYAAAYWTSHFSDVLPERRPSARQLTALCSKGSRRLENWVEKWQRPSCSYLPEFEFPELLVRLDPLVITAMFGPAASVTDILASNLDYSMLAKDSAWTAVKHSFQRGDVSLIKTLVQHEVLGPILCCCKLLDTARFVWKPQGDNATIRCWEEIFEFLISQLRENLIDYGNYMLRQAARSGCLVLVKKLFEAGARDAELRQAMLTPEAEPSLWDSSFKRHQSIGEAAAWGHADMVRFLCEQPGLESDLRYVNEGGYTFFHQAMQWPNKDVLRTLVRHWPEGIDIMDKDGYTPLKLLVFNCPRSETWTVEFARLMLHEGKADANVCEGGGRDSPLCTAARRGYMSLSRTLIVEGGADVFQVLDIDGMTGRPFLKKGMYPDEKVRDQMLEVLCSLLPLAVSVEYLFSGRLIVGL
ncbi:hypothetical protein N0V88_003044 [Collariella sp. IMI 366227]|nr:hypothetical protein N0V88_003044 [Collariella sp. IMI 366227]